MTTREIESLLYEYPLIPNIIIDLERQIRDINDEIEVIRDSVPSLQLGDGIRGNSVSDPTYNKVERILTIYGNSIKRINEEIQRRKKNQKTIKNVLSKLTPTEIKVIEYRYFKPLPWENVAKNSGVTKRTCMRYRNKTIKIIKYAMR